MTKERKQEIISTYRRDDKDTGSSEVQIALLTEIYSDACVNRSQIQPGRKCPRNLRQSDKERKHFNNRKRVI